QNATLEIMCRRFAVQFLFQHLMENLKRARSVNKRRARTGHEWRPDRDAVAIARIIVVQREDRLESAGKIQQLPNRDSGFARIVSPRGNGVAHVLVEAE